MATQPVPPAPTLPTAPDPANRSNFNNLAYAWGNALGPFSIGLQALAVNVKANADEAEAAATIAATAATAAAASATASAAAAATALNAPGTSATSTTSLAISAGSKTLTIQAGKLFVMGQFVVLASTANVSNYMHGQITGYNSTTGQLTVNVLAVGGSGTFADWSVSPTSSGNITLDGVQTLSNKIFKNTGVGYYAAGNVTTLNFADGSHQRWAPTGTKTLAISGWGPTGSLSQIMIEGVDLGAATITWPTINWLMPDGTTTTSIGTYLSALGRTLRTSGTDWVLVWTRDAGTLVWGKFL